MTGILRARWLGVALAATASLPAVAVADQPSAASSPGRLPPQGAGPGSSPSAVTAPASPTGSAPLRGLARFPLVQFAVVIGVILWLQAADDKSMFGQLFNVLDKLVESTVELVSKIVTVKTFTRSWLTFGFMIAYVYLAGSLLWWLLRLLIAAAVDFAGRHNLLYLRRAIARERGILAYRAWVPFERIRPADIPQQDWEEAFAWPANNLPPYPPHADAGREGARCPTAPAAPLIPSVWPWVAQVH